MNTNLPPKVFIGIPTFKRLENLQAAIKSVQCQTFENYTCMISDNANETEVSNYISSLGDTRFVYQGHPFNLGMYGNWQFLLNSVPSASLYAFLEDDNLWNEKHIERAVAAFERFPDAALCFSKASDYVPSPTISHKIIRDFHFDPLDSKDYVRLDASSFLGTYLCGCYVLASSVVLKVSNLNPDFRLEHGLPYCNDYVSWGKILLDNSVIYSPESTMTYFVHEGSASAFFAKSGAPSCQLRKARSHLLEDALRREKISAKHIESYLLNFPIVEGVSNLVVGLLAHPGNPQAYKLGINIWRNRRDIRQATGGARACARLGIGFAKYLDRAVVLRARIRYLCR